MLLLIQQLPQLPRPYVMKTHLRSETFRKQIQAGKVKVIICIRNPKDTLISYYHFYRMNSMLGNFKGTWDEFFELYEVKHLIYGDYFQWYVSWLQHLDKANVMLIKYEDMHHKLPDVINDVSEFLGKRLPEHVTDDVIQHLTFDSMSSNDAVNHKNRTTFDQKISPFMRKGKIGDWKNYLTEAQSALVDKTYKEIIEPMGITLMFE